MYRYTYSDAHWNRVTTSMGYVRWGGHQCNTQAAVGRHWAQQRSREIRWGLRRQHVFLSSSSSSSWVGIWLYWLKIVRVSGEMLRSKCGEKRERERERDTERVRPTGLALGWLSQLQLAVGRRPSQLYNNKSGNDVDSDDGESEESTHS